MQTILLIPNHGSMVYEITYLATPSIAKGLQITHKYNDADPTMITIES